MPAQEQVSYQFVVTKEEENTRIDVYLQKKIKDISRTQIQELIESYLVKVNNIVPKPSYRIKKKDVVDITIPPPTPIELEPEEYPLKILYEDEYLLVTNKDAGIAVHPTTGNYKGTLVNYLLHHCKDLSGIGGELRPGIVHRLDKETSGLMVIAKNDFAHLSLSEQFKKRKVKKIYNAIVKGRINYESGYIRKSIIRDPHNRKKMAAIDTLTIGKQALTYYEVIENFANASFLKIHLYTGRTHQIRVHFASIGHPLFGDSIYLNKKKELDRFGLALCARELSFFHPKTKEIMSFSVDLPDRFFKILEKLKK